MNPNFCFTFENLRRHFQTVLECGYEVIRCRDFLEYKKTGSRHKVVVNRVDIDFSMPKARRIATLFNELGIKGSFFVRMHAHEYNPFSFENYRILKFIRDTGHEIGYHSEVNDLAAIWNEPAEKCLTRDLDILRTMLETEVVGCASHGGMTGLNNLDFWKERKPGEYGLWYEGYDHQPQFNLFQESLYVSDSSWTYWKCYDNGKLVDGDRRDLGEHAREGRAVIYSLIHPETYYDEHFYE